MFRWPQEQLGRARLHEAPRWGYDIRIVRCSFWCRDVRFISLDMHDTLLQYSYIYERSKHRWVRCLCGNAESVRATIIHKLPLPIRDTYPWGNNNQWGLDDNIVHTRGMPVFVLKDKAVLLTNPSSQHRNLPVPRPCLRHKDSCLGNQLE